MSGIDAVAEYIGTAITEPSVVYAGMIPEPREGGIIAALTERPGGPADTRRSAVRYDDPAYTLHLIGDDLADLDLLADRVRALDRTAHIRTAAGEINTFRVLPPDRRMGMRRPRYTVTLGIDAEVVETAEIRTITIGDTPFTVTGGVAVMTSAEYLAACGFGFREVEI